MRAYFRSFILGPGKSILFTSLFYSLWLVINWATPVAFDLHSFTGRMIGIATLEAIDVEARVSMFYKCLLLFAGSFSIFTIIGYFIFSKNSRLLYSSENRIINFMSIAGLIIFVFKVFETEVYETLEIIYFLHKLMLASIILRFIFFKKNEISLYQFSIVLCLAVSSYFLIADLNNLAGYINNPDFYFVTFIIAYLMLIALNIFLKSKTAACKQYQTNLISFALLPLIGLPFISILKDEIFLIFKANNLFLSSPLIIYLVLMVLLVFAGIIRYKKGRRRELNPERDQLFRSYFPLLIFSLTAYMSYSYFEEYYDEIFEAGNVYLPIMEYKLFGTLSPLEKLNTHLLSDYFFSAIYTFFNGLKINEITLYEFLLVPINYTLYYYLIKYLTRNGFIAVFFIMLFPYVEAILPLGFCLSILGIFALSKTIGPKQSLKNYLFYFLILLFLASWRIDFGFTCLLTLPLLLLFYNFRDPEYKINWPILFKAGTIVAGAVVILIGMMSFYRHINFFAKASYLLNYCMSAQSYSYRDIGDGNSPSFKMHYLIFPAVVALILITLVIKYKQLNKSKGQRLAYLSLLFITIFYLVNFNRGLIRHSLLEGSDIFTSSFIYIILPGSAFILFKKENQIVRGLLFFILSFFLVNTYKVPNAKGQSGLFEKLENKIKTSKNINLAKIESRIKNSPGKNDVRYKSFTDFMLKHTKADETFIDFANRPMLYFFSRKITPSWFYQNPLCEQNDFLQKKFIKDLSNYKTPYLLFSGMSQLGYDGIDDVPNTLRHYRMAEYFYNNYKPFIIIDGLCLWKNNTTTDIDQKDTVFRYHQTTGRPSTLKTIKTQLKINPDKKYIVKITSKDKLNNDLQVFFNGNSFSPAKNSLKDNLVYYLIDVKGKRCELSLKNDSNLIDFLVVESDYIPDYFSEKCLSYDFRKLPFIWGTYDETISKELLQYEKNGSVTFENSVPVNFAIPENIDRSTGNTVIITCKNNTGKPQKLRLSFGNANEINRTAIKFDIMPSAKEERYAIRISSIHKWYSGNINQTSITSETDKGITLSKIQISKGT